MKTILIPIFFLLISCGKESKNSNKESEPVPQAKTTDAPVPVPETTPNETSTETEVKPEMPKVPELPKPEPKPESKKEDPVIEDFQQKLFLFEKDFKVYEKEGVVFVETNPFKTVDTFKKLKGIVINSESLYNLNFSEREIYLQPAKHDNSLLYPRMGLDWDLEYVKKNKVSPFVDITFDGKEMVDTIDYLLNFRGDKSHERFMISILLTDSSLPEKPVRAIILIPILL